jgi:hypothetical protein
MGTGDVRRILRASCLDLRVLLWQSEKLTERELHGTDYE